MTHRRADCLLRGDVIKYNGVNVAVTEPSDQVSSAHPSETFYGIPAAECCEPRIAYLGTYGRLTHRTTYIILPSKKRVRIIGYLDLDTRGATAKMDVIQDEP